MDVMPLSDPAVAGIKTFADVLNSGNRAQNCRYGGDAQATNAQDPATIGRRALLLRGAGFLPVGNRQDLVVGRCCRYRDRTQTKRWGLSSRIASARASAISWTRSWARTASARASRVSCGLCASTT